jgi:hypothetical protein
MALGQPRSLDTRSRGWKKPELPVHFTAQAQVASRLSALGRSVRACTSSTERAAGCAMNELQSGASYCRLRTTVLAVSSLARSARWPGVPYWGRSIPGGNSPAISRMALRTGRHSRAARVPSRRLRSRCESRRPTVFGSLRRTRSACSSDGVGALSSRTRRPSDRCSAGVARCLAAFDLSSGCSRKTSTTRTSIAPRRAPRRLRAASLRHRVEHQIGRRPTPR